MSACAPLRALALAALAGAAPALAAQVGYPPAHSPYHDAPEGLGPIVTAGYLAGGRGPIPVGISDGNTWGVRLEVPLGSPFLFSTGLAYGQTTRRIANPFVPESAAISKLYDADVVVLDAGLLLALTGRKTWHGLQPYASASMGLAFGSELGSDSSGYAFGTKFTIEPGLGMRVYPARHLVLNLDFRTVFWRLSYPTSYKVPNSVDGTRLLDINAADSYWTVHPWVTLGLGWTF